jgi:ADP-L-glycero-D-manno-heptose 6-epimerase
MSVARKSIIVTGGAGCIGRNLVAALNERGEENILLVDRLGPSEKWRNLAGLFFEDLVDTNDFRARVRAGNMPAASVVFHVDTWCPSGGAAAATPDADALVDGNYRYTRELCEACLRANVRFVHATSAATYGAGEAGYFDRDDTTLRLQPVSAFGLSKHLFDLWALRAGHYAKIAGLKLFDVYGPGEENAPEPRSLVPAMVRQIRATGGISLFKSHRAEYADGEQMRDFVHVKDVVAMLLFFLDHPETGGLFNCGTGRARSFADLARAVFAAMGREPTIHFVDLPEPLRASYQYFAQAEISKARAAGFTQAFITLEDGVRDYVEAHLLARADAT